MNTLQILKNYHSLRTEHIVLLKNQIVQIKVGYKFSFFKWLKNISSEDMSFNNGYYEIYKPTLLTEGTEFIKLDLAITNLNRYTILTSTIDGPAFKVKNMSLKEGQDIQLIKSNIST